MVVWVKDVKTSHFLEVVCSVSVWRGIVMSVGGNHFTLLFLASVSNHQIPVTRNNFFPDTV